MDELQYCEILKTNINVTNMQETVSYIYDHIDELRGRYICVSNVHTTVMSYENPEYRKIQNSAAMALPDGSPLSAYSRHKGYKHAKRVTGPDLMCEIMNLQSEKKLRHYFYGSKQETLDEIQGVIEKYYPQVEVAGLYSPPFRKLSPEESEDVIDMINQSGPDIIWVGLGAPKQEEWMYEFAGKTNAVMIGVGAGFNYLAGSLKRAPQWMQNRSLEWVYRLLQEPRRLFRRYMTSNFKFLYYLVINRIKKWQGKNER